MESSFNERFAKQVVAKSMRICEGESVFIYSVREGIELAEAIALECELIGAKPLLVSYSNDYFVKAVTKPPEKFVEATPKLMLKAVEASDAYIAIGRPALGEAPVSRIGAWRRGRKPVGDAMDRNNVRWVGIGYPTPGRAKESGMSLAKFRKVIMASLDIDYDALVKAGHKLVQKVLDAEKVHVTSPKGTDVEFQVKGRKWIIDDGVISKEDEAAGDVGLNLPCGEVFICPIENSANGTIFFDVPTSYYGHTMKGIRLDFKDGKAINYDAEYGLKDFKAMLDAATGDKDRMAEFAIGLNPKAKFINDVLVDEKVLGTVHFAIGDNKGPAYGGTNNSSIHWDLVMTKPTVEVDGKTVMKNGNLKL